MSWMFIGKNELPVLIFFSLLELSMQDILWSSGWSELIKGLQETKHDGRVRAMVFNTTFNNISVILWRSVLLVEETGVPRENQTCHCLWQTWSHNVVSSTPHHEWDLNSSVVIGTDGIGSCEPYDHNRKTAGGQIQWKTSCFYILVF
jgi:hypothetical protein